MKELSNEELVTRIQAVTIRIGMGGYTAEKIDEALELEAELLSRLNRLEEAEKEKQLYAEQVFMSVVEHHCSEVADMEKEIESLKCCGNCHSYNEETLPCDDGYLTTAERICDNWQSDNLTREERK